MVIFVEIESWPGNGRMDEEGADLQQCDTDDGKTRVCEGISLNAICDIGLDRAALGDCAHARGRRLSRLLRGRHGAWLFVREGGFPLQKGTSDNDFFTTRPSPTRS